ncbi:hypothetical protein Hte_005316 [Hypoxylon texense]
MGHIRPVEVHLGLLRRRGRQGGVAEEDVGRQLEAEYGVPWTYMPTPGPELTGPEVRVMKARFKEASLEWKDEEDERGG